MENENKTPNNLQNTSSGKVMAGLFLIVVGLIILSAKLKFLFLPHWVFSWEMFLIGLGLFIGFKDNFRKTGWLVLVLIGSVFLINDMVEGINLKFYFWPILFIGIGLWIMLKPRRNHAYYTGPAGNAAPGTTYAASTTSARPEQDYTSEEVVNATAVLGGIKKSIISKNFLGGEVTSVFGGTELNLSQADIQHPVILEATQIFGGTTLIVPPHWQIKSEMVAILGGIDDKRPVLPGGYDQNKVLILKGTTLFGGLSIKSY